MARTYVRDSRGRFAAHSSFSLSQPVLNEKTTIALENYMLKPGGISKILRRSPEAAAQDSLVNFSSEEYARIKGDVNSSCKQIATIDKAMNESHMNEATILYRGIRSDTFAESMKPGFSFVDKSFTSTSSSASVAHDFADSSYRSGKKVIMEVEVPKGTRALDLEKTQYGSNVMQQKEVLLDRGGHYKVKHVEDDGEYLHVRVELIEQSKGESPKLTATFAQVRNFRD